MPATFEPQATVAVPDPITLLGLIAPQTSPDGIESVRDTVPANWFRPAMVIVEEPFEPASAVTGVVAVMVKSLIWNVVFAECTRAPLVPVSVRV